MAQSDLTAADVKETLRRRHPAQDPANPAIVGRWVTLEEWASIDLLALDAWQAGARVGYEVKVSRADYKAELMNPAKRVRSVVICTKFYFAVPYGLLTDEEKAFEEPDWQPEDFVRSKCSNPHCRFWEGHPHWVHRRIKKSKTPMPRGSRLKGTSREGVSVNLPILTSAGRRLYGDALPACCYVCKGRGITEKSKVELDWAGLWIPKDVGLIEVGRRDWEIVREAPTRKPLPMITRDCDLHALVRWSSMRPDPRHRGA